MHSFFQFHEIKADQDVKLPDRAKTPKEVYKMLYNTKRENKSILHDPQVEGGLTGFAPLTPFSISQQSPMSSHFPLNQQSFHIIGTLLRHTSSQNDQIQQEERRFQCELYIAP